MCNEKGGTQEASVGKLEQSSAKNEGTAILIKLGRNTTGVNGERVAK
jgi:hypothetical protein